MKTAKFTLIGGCGDGEIHHISDSKNTYMVPELLKMCFGEDPPVAQSVSRYKRIRFTVFLNTIELFIEESLSTKHVFDILYTSHSERRDSQ